MKKAVPFYEQLRLERERRGWSQEDLAAKVGSDTKTVGRWEMGKSLPQPFFRQALCELFGKDAVEFGLVTETVANSDNINTPQPNVIDEQLPTSAPISDISETLPELGTKLCTYDVHSSWVIAVAWEPGGNRIVSAGADSTVQVWNSGTGQHLLTYRGHAPTGFLAKTKLQPTVYNVSWSPSEPLIASSGAGKTVKVWDANTANTNFTYQGHSGLWTSVYAFAWSPDGTRIASACSSMGMDRTIHVWKVKTARSALRFNTNCGLTPTFSVLALAWSPDGSRIASTCGDKTIHIWDAISGKLHSTYTAFDWVSDLAWSPDGKLLATASSDHTAQIWDTTKGEIILTYSGHSDSVREVAWSPDGNWIASASNDTTVQLWEAATGKSIFTYRGHSAWTTSVAWSPDGTRVASASNDKTVQIWQAKK